MSGPAISIRGLRKAYRLYPHPRDMMLELLSGRTRHQDFVALDNITFDVQPGSVVGLLGRNGAGKSTLLRIIAGTLDATAGSVSTRGRVAAILELGTGFHPDYTGRENIYLGGLCLGLTRKEVDRRVEEVIEFSELGDHIDQPFRTYSSGMQSRLAFSVATCVDPDVLIVDEALSVGDARFALKSFDRIRVFKQRGKSILMVSHSINQIASICDRAILLERGRMIMDGDANSVGNFYHEMLFGPPVAEAELPEQVADEADILVADAQPGEPAADGVTEFGVPEPGAAEFGAAEPGVAARAPDVADVRLIPAAGGAPESGRERRYGDGTVRIIAFRLVDLEGRSVRRARSCSIYFVEIVVRASRKTNPICAGILVRNGRGQDLFGTDMVKAGTPLFGPLEPGEQATVRIRIRLNLAAGTYFFTAGLAYADEYKLDMRFDALMIEVEQVPGLYTDTVVNLEPTFETTLALAATA